MKKNNIIISNPKEFEKKKEKFLRYGKYKVHIISDFDKTLTKSLYKGEKSGSLISRLRNGKYLTKDYAERAHALFDKYHPIEIDPNISQSKKNKKMYEWWRIHKELLIESGLNKKTIEKCVNEMIDKGVPKFRSGIKKFLISLKKDEVPLIILSSSLEDLIKEFLKQKNVNYENIHIIGNSFEFDKYGKAIGIKRIIHVFSKNEANIEGLPIYNKLTNRRNVILLGDSLGDLGMIEGFNYDNLIKIGFLNENIGSNLDKYKQSYDVVIMNDGDFSFINGLVREIFNIQTLSNFP